MKNHNHHSCRALLGVLLITAACLCRSQATTLLVYNSNNNGAGSLRQAIADNNALGGGNTILFSNVVNGTITLTTGELLITRSVTILGPGANVLAVNGNAASRVFHITNSTVALFGLTITNGFASGSSPAKYGGGIFNDHSTLTVSNCTLSGNSADSGGGVFNNGVNSGNATLTISASTLSGNSASSTGGGIYNYGINSGNATLTISASTLSGNSAPFFGGGIYNYGTGDGSATLSISASTLSGNSASTFGGGIYCATYPGGHATLTIGDTILKNGASGANIVNSGGTVILSLGYNLSSDNGGGFLTAVGDQPGIDPLLGPLQNNGGPTLTHAPLPGSPAIDQGKNLSGLATDQRGRLRIFDNSAIPPATLGDNSDIGAVEVYPPISLVVSNTNDSGNNSLRQTIVDAAPVDTITFNTGVTGTVTLTSGELLIDKNATIIGPGAKVLSVSGNHVSRVFHIAPGVTATLSGLTITNGLATGTYPAERGGGIFNDYATLTVSNSVLTGNSALYGGGIFNNGDNAGIAKLTVGNSTLSGNSAQYGGGIYNDGFNTGDATLTISASTLNGNSASTSGGGIYNACAYTGFASLTILGSTLSGNLASTSGGGIYNDAEFSGFAPLTILGSTFSDNLASTSGGGIYNDGNNTGYATLRIQDTILKAGALGANIVNSLGTVISFGYNLSSDNGGGFLTATADQINTNPLLGPLADNGGPTFTHSLLAGSPAIDKGQNFDFTTDQRAAPRPFDFASISNASGGNGSDIGAFELGSPNLSISRSPPNVVVSWPNYYGDFTLQQNTNSLASVNWSNSPGAIQDDGTKKTLIINPPTGSRFYRLFKP